MSEQITYQDLGPGVSLGHYIITERIAHGGMGTVFKALEPALERYVAIKVLLPQYAANPDYVQYFQDEARAVAALRHPNIVPIYFIGLEGGIAFFAMAYIEGETFDDWIETKRIFNSAQAKWFMDQSLAALQSASEANIVHLDIKPANFLIDKSNTIMLTDFGLAQRIGKQDVAEGEREAFGTPAYVSPEQIKRERTDQRTDIYSLGASLFHLMVGKPPYDGEKVEDIVWGHLEKPFPVNLAQEAGLQSGWIYLIKKMMERNPADRFQNYQQMRDALKDIEHFRYESVTLHIETPPPIAAPRENQNPEQLHGILKSGSAWVTGGGGGGANIQLSRSQILENYKNNPRPLSINKMVGTLKDLCRAEEGDPEDLLNAFEKIDKLRDAAHKLAQFMASSDEEFDDESILETLGLARTRNLALTFFLIDYETTESNVFDWRPLWQHQLSTALVLDFIYDALDLRRSELEYIAGLSHDIGKLIFGELYSFVYFNIMDRSIKDKMSLTEIETKMMGITHSEMGGIWMKDNGFPNLLVEVVEAHKHPEKVKKKPLLLHALVSANHLTKQLGLGYSGCSWLEKRTWEEHPSTFALWEARRVREYTYEDFTADFMRQFEAFPTLI